MKKNSGHALANGRRPQIVERRAEARLAIGTAILELLVLGLDQIR